MVADPYDPADLSLSGEMPHASTPKHPPRHKKGEKFLRGPIPLLWIDVASRLPGKALAVGLRVWFESGCRGDRTVSVTLARLARAGMTTSTARRAVRELERAGLITVERPTGTARWS